MNIWKHRERQNGLHTIIRSIGSLAIVVSVALSATVIPVYSQQGKSRVIGDSSVSRTVIVRRALLSSVMVILEPSFFPEQPTSQLVIQMSLSVFMSTIAERAKLYATVPVGSSPSRLSLR